MLWLLMGFVVCHLAFRKMQLKSFGNQKSDWNLAWVVTLFWTLDFIILFTIKMTKFDHLLDLNQKIIPNWLNTTGVNKLIPAPINIIEIENRV